MLFPIKFSYSPAVSKPCLVIVMVLYFRTEQCSVWVFSFENLKVCQSFLKKPTSQNKGVKFVFCSFTVFLHKLMLDFIREFKTC